jgi:hypothetical protein
MYKNYAANIKLMPRETKIVTFPNGYFKIIPTVTVISQKNIVPSIDVVTKKYFKLTNPTSMSVVFSYIATTTRQQKKIFADLDSDNSFLQGPTESSDFDNDGIVDDVDLDDDNDGYTDIEEIVGGSDPLDASSIPQPAAVELKSIYIALETVHAISDTDEMLTIYSGEMFDLTYPEIIDLQPDSNGNTNYEIISYNPNDFNNLSLEPSRIKSINTNTYVNSGNDVLFRLDNIVTGQEYKIFIKARTLSGNDNQPQIQIALKSSSSSEEDSSTFFGDLNAASYTNTMPLDNIVDLNFPKYWIHSFTVDSNDSITLTTSNGLDAPFADSTFAFLNIHSKYTQNSDLTSPSIEIAIQDASYDQNNNGIDSYAGYIFAGSYELESLSPNLYSTIQNGNYGAIETSGSSDSNTDNHSRINVMLDARVRYRMHVKVAQGTDCDFSINFNPQDMFNYIDIDTYNQDFNSDSNVIYHNLIPSNHDSSVSQTYYYYFTIREDGFIVWE